MQLLEDQRLSSEEDKLWWSPDSKEKGKVLWKVLPAAIMWIIWKTRNDVAFNNDTINVEDTKVKIKLQAFFWVSGEKCFKGLSAEYVVSYWERFFRIH
ncbi:hypothetical protein BVC80_1829g14 [Macleaya cordata]|uniref:Reverse transcriptase zinc-binding domain n=1 Tax=Macleaya cordata TaxID=56857 RepID=A0A200PMI2_MACCD|nr:hypothetical protein BVC80_8053g4 [Macleaya cordata]OVA15732.1 hypothetical protein BVC80_1829g14 [Macleaya cordata]